VSRNGGNFPENTERDTTQESWASDSSKKCCLTEDSADSMPPGTYHTELNVPVDSDEKISTAVEKVISSYQRDVHGGALMNLTKYSYKGRFLPLL